MLAQILITPLSPLINQPRVSSVKQGSAYLNNRNINVRLMRSQLKYFNFMKKHFTEHIYKIDFSRTKTFQRTQFR